MYFPRDNVTQHWHNAGDFGVYRPQNLGYSPNCYMVNDSTVNHIRDAVHSGLGSFINKLGHYSTQIKGAVIDKKDLVIDEFENLVCKMNNRSAKSGNRWFTKDDIIDKFENIVDKSKKLSLFANSRVNIPDLKEEAVDNFEELVEKTKMFGLKTTEKIRKVTCLKDLAIENFEELFEKSKEVGMKAKSHVGKVNFVKETVKDEAVNNFENFIDKSKDLGLKTTYNLKKVESLGEKAVDEFEYLIQRLNSKTGSVEKNFKYYADETKEDIIDGFEEIFDKFKNNTNIKTNKVECIKEQVIDEFEDLVQRLKMKIMDLEGNVKCYTEEKGENLVEEFEELVSKMRNFGKSVVEKTNDQVLRVNCVKEEIVDSFENLVIRLNDFGLRTDNEIRQKLDCIKEEVVDDFENLVERFNVNLKCVEDNVIGHTCENKAFIVEQFEDIIDDLKEEINFIDYNLREKVDEFFEDFQDIFDETKCLLECKTFEIFENAECAFEVFVDQMEEAFECGKCDVESELYSVKYWLYMGEMVIKDFLCYSERMVEEFCRFSEKRVACFLCAGKQKAKVFYNEVVDSLVRGFEDKLLCDNLVLEINSSRYAYNVTMSEVNFHVVRALLTLPGPDGHSWQHVVSRLNYFMPILTNYIRSEAAQKDCLLAIEDVAGSHPHIFAVLVKIIHWLYEHDILSEDIILDWYNNPCSDADPNNSSSVRQQVASFIRWLQEAEEDDDDDDD